MKKYWVITPYNRKRIRTFDTAWKYDLENNTIAIGYSQLGDVSNSSEDQMRERFNEACQKDPKTKKNAYRAVRQFYHEISVGDFLIARKGRKQIIGIGEVIGSAFYNPEEGKKRTGNSNDGPFSNFLKVKWEEKNIRKDKMCFSMQAFYKISEEKYNELLKE